MASPPFVAAEVHPDGSGATFFDPAGRPTKLYGGPSLVDFARTLGPMATSPGALAQAMGPNTPNYDPLPGSAPSPAPRMGGAGPGTPDFGAAPPDAAWAQAAAAEQARGEAAQAAAAQAEQAQLAEQRAAINAQRAQQGLPPMASMPDPATLRAPAPGAEGAPQAGGGIGTSRAAPPGRAPSGGPQFPGLDEGMGAYGDAATLADMALRSLYGQKGSAAGWRLQGRTTQRDGVASGDTQQAIEQSAQAAAAGRAQQIGAMQAGDQGTSTAYQQGALDLVNLLTQLAGTQRQAAEQGTARANDLERQAARADSPFARVMGAVDGLFAGADAISQGRDVSAAREGAANAPQARADALRQQAYATRQGVTQGAMQQMAAAAPLVDALAQARARAATSGAQGAGRAGEATTALAQGDLEAARSRGAREAAQMGTSNTSEKYNQGGGGGPNFAQLMQAAQFRAGLGTAYANAGAVRAAGKGGGEPYTLIIQGKRVPVSASVPQGVTSALTEQAQGLSMAKDALDRVEAAAAKLGAGAWTPERLQGADGAAYREAVTTLARAMSVAEGQKSLTDSDRERAEANFLDPQYRKGAIREARQKLSSNATRLTRLASGMD